MVATVLDFKNRNINPHSVTTDTPTSDELLRSVIAQLGEIQNQVSYSNEQNEYLKELLEKSRSQQALSSLTSFTYPLSFGSAIPDTQYVFTIKGVNAQKETNIQSTHGVGTAMVSLHMVLETGALLLCFISLAGISSWLLNDSPIVSPFAATLGLLASPFFYAMGRVARK